MCRTRMDHMRLSWYILERRFFYLYSFLARNPPRKGGGILEERVAIIGIFVHNPEAAVKANEILHAYAGVIVGRMGIPYREKSINIISVIVNASANEISSLAGKLGRLEGITVKSMQTSNCFMTKT